MGQVPVPLFYHKEDIKMPLNETFTGIIEKLTQRIDELKAQMDALDIKSTTAYNTSVSLADAIKAQAEALAALQTQVNDIANTRSVTFTTPPTADSTGLPAFVVLDTKPETEYQNYVYIYPRN